MNPNFRLGRPLVLIAGALVAANAMAVLQDSVTFSNVIPAFGMAVNVTTGTLRTNVFTVSGYTLGRIDFSGNTTQINGTVDDWVADNFMRIVSPGGAQFAERTVGTTLNYTGTATFAGSFAVNAGAIAPFGGGTWNFYFVNTIDDGLTGQADNVLNITFNLTDEAIVPPTATATYNPLTDGLTTNSQTYSANQVRWYKLVLPTGTGPTRFLDLDTETSASFAITTALAIWDNSGNVIASDTDDGSRDLSQLTFGAQINPRPTFSTSGNAPSLPYNGRDGNLAAGTYYVSVNRAFSTYGPLWSATSNSALTAGLTFRANYSTASGIPASVDLGTLSVGTVSQTFSQVAGEVKWFKFTLDASTSLTRFLDVDMNTSSSDFDFALFNTAGTPIYYVDGWEGTAQSFAPYFSFGGADNPRPAIPNRTRAFAGHSGNLAPGTYYMAVARHELFVAAPFSATTDNNTSTGTNLPLRLTLGNVIPPPSPLFVQRMTGLNRVPDNAGGMSTMSGISVPPDVSDRQVADDFTVTNPSGWTVVLAEGTFIRSTNGTLPTAVNVVIYQKSGGLPGAVVSSQTVPWSTVVPIDNGLFGTTNVPLRYRVSISPVNLAAGEYFLMLQPVSPINNFWLQSSPDTPVTGSPAVFRRGPASTGTSDSSAGYPSSWTATGTPPFVTPVGMTVRLEGILNAPVFFATAIVNLGQLGAPSYNTGSNLPTSIPVSFRNAANNEVATSTATYNPTTGAFSAAVPIGVIGPYRISFKVGFWLRRTLPNPAGPAAPLGNVNFGMVAPAVGDADDDNAVTPSDYGIWQVQNGTFPTENTGADFDGDGAVTPSDYGLWQINNGAFGDD